MNNELYHYGVPGMKWGVRRYRNADGTLTTAGKKKYSIKLYNEIGAESRKDYHNSHKRVLEKHPELNELYNRNNLIKARADIDKINQVEREYYKNYSKYEKYVRIAAKKEADKYGFNFEDVLWGYMNEDFDQGYSFDEYLNGEYRGGAKAYYKRLNDAHTAYKNECRKVVNEFLGKSGKLPIKDVYGSERRHDPNLVIEDLLDRVAFDERMERY